MATYVDGRPRPFTAGAAGPEDFQSLSVHGQPLRPAVDSDSRKAYYKALNRLSKTVADLLESMGREDPRHHDTPLPQRSGLAVYVAETTAELEGARAGLCDDAEKSARTRTDIRRMLAASRGTDGSNPVPSSGQSASRGILPSHGEKPAFRAGVWAWQVQRGQQRRVSRAAWRRQVGISLSGQIPVPRRRCGGGLINSDRAQAKPSTDRCSCQASGRRECASSLSAVKSRG